MNPTDPIPWFELTNLGANVAIVVLFLWYLTKRDKVMQQVSEQCHKTQEAGHTAIKELTIAVIKLNGRK